MEDRRLGGLKLAARYWGEARNADKALKLQFAKELHGFQLFSLTQLAKIVRTPTKNVAAVLEKNSGGGRFEPESLTALVEIRKQVMANQRVAPMLLRLVLESGTSFSCVVSLTGLSYGAYYRDVPNEFRREDSGE